MNGFKYSYKLALHNLNISNGKILKTIQIIKNIIKKIKNNDVLTSEELDFMSIIGNNINTLKTRTQNLARKNLLYYNQKSPADFTNFINDTDKKENDSSLVYKKLDDLCNNIIDNKFSKITDKDIPLLRFIVNQKIPVTFKNTNDVLEHFQFKRPNNNRLVVKLKK